MEEFNIIETGRKDEIEAEIRRFGSKNSQRKRLEIRRCERYAVWEMDVNNPLADNECSCWYPVECGDCVEYPSCIVCHIGDFICSSRNLPMQTRKSIRIVSWRK